MALHTITNAIGKFVAKYGDDALRAVKNTADKVDDATRLAILNSGGLDDASIFLGKCTGKVDDMVKTVGKQADIPTCKCKINDVAELLGKGTDKVDDAVKTVGKRSGISIHKDAVMIKDGPTRAFKTVFRDRFATDYVDAKTGIIIRRKAPVPEVEQSWFSRILDGPKPVIKDATGGMVIAKNCYFTISEEDFKAIIELAEGELEKSPIWQRILKMAAGF